MAHLLVYNPADVPVVIDEAGHTCEGRSWASADGDTDQVKTALGLGQLVPAADPGKDANPTAVAAFEAVQKSNKKPRGSAAKES